MVGAREELAKLVKFLPRNSVYNVTRRSELKNTSHIVYVLNDIDGFCNLA